MLTFILGVLVVLALLLVSEFLWRKKVINTEISRKLVHILVATFVAFWPIYIGWGYIELLGIAFVVVVLISLEFNVFKSIHSISRATSGELFFAFAVIVLAMFFRTKWIFAAAMLNLGVADGLAALMGVHAKKNKHYKVFGSNKSILGTLTFFLVSFLIIEWTAVLWGHAPTSILIWLPILTTIIENVSVYGSDNLFVPVFIAIALRWL